MLVIIANCANQLNCRSVMHTLTVAAEDGRAKHKRCCASRGHICHLSKTDGGISRTGNKLRDIVRAAISEWRCCIVGQEVSTTCDKV